MVDKKNNKVYHNFHNQLLYVETKISSSDLQKLKNKAKDCLKNQNNFKNSNNTLAGNIEKEFHLNESFAKILFPYSSLLADKFEKINHETKHDEKQSNTIKQVSNWVSTGSWINFQKKYEFNPIHQHSGDYSFVLWIQIPYDLKEELEFKNSKNSNEPLNSLFSFTYLNQYGQIVESELPIDKTWEGTMILFSSKLRHQVFPFFTSDDYRISISGNLIEMTKYKKTLSYQ